MSFASSGATSQAAQLLAMQKNVGNTSVSSRINKFKGPSLSGWMPEQTGIQITGGYETTSEPLATLQLNQAGHHVEGWLQVRTAGAAGIVLSNSVITGDLISDESEKTIFACRQTPQGGGPSVMVTLIAKKLNQTINIELRPNDQSQAKNRLLKSSEKLMLSRTRSFERVTTQARLSEGAIASLPPELAEQARSEETAPLHISEFKQVQRTAFVILQHMNEYLAATNDSARRIAIYEVDQAIATEFKNYDPAQWPRVTHFLYLSLSKVGIEQGFTTRPVWDWLHIAVAMYPLYTLKLQERFGITPTKGVVGTDIHRYRWHTVTAGPSAQVGPLGGSFGGGVLIMEKLEPDRWITGYGITQVGATMGVGVGVGYGEETSPNEFESPFNYTPEDFVGRFSLFEAKGEFGPVSYAGEEENNTSQIVFHGNGSMPPVSAPAGGFSKKFGLGIGITGGATLGYLTRDRNTKRIAKSGHSAEVSGKLDHTAVFQTSFEVNSAFLTDAGRAAIRKFCALERSALSSSSSTLRAYGYASTTGTTEYNDNLARLRAFNTIQAIMDVMGEDFAIPDSHLRYISYGETAARNAGVGDDIEYSHWRRVDIFLNDTRVLTLRDP